MLNVCESLAMIFSIKTFILSPNTGRKESRVGMPIWLLVLSNQDPIHWDSHLLPIASSIKIKIISDVWEDTRNHRIVV